MFRNSRMPTGEFHTTGRNDRRHRLILCRQLQYCGSLPRSIKQHNREHDRRQRHCSRTKLLGSGVSITSLFDSLHGISTGWIACVKRARVVAAHLNMNHYYKFIIVIDFRN